uniref:Uncharacterized protein n=1 Tax=Ditylenchus dipsaci TaxID=166011 RepID=A0A915E4G8_9BILA
MLGDTATASTQLPTFLTSQVSVPAEGISGWTLALIVIGSLTLVAALAVGAYLLFRRIKDQRKNHGSTGHSLRRTCTPKTYPTYHPQH